MSRTTKNPEDPYALRPSEERFANLLARSADIGDAYRRTHNTSGVRQQTVTSRASRLANSVRIRLRVRTLVDALKSEDLESQGRAFAILLNDMDKCRELKNMAALATFSRLKLQCLRMISDQVTVSEAGRLTDAELIRKIAGGNKAVEAELERMIGSESDYVQ